MPRQDKHCTEVDFGGYKELLNKPSREAPLQLAQLDVSTELESASNSKRKASPRNDHVRKVLGGGPKGFGLTQVCESTSRRLIVREESPWDTYRRKLRCDLAGEVIIAARCYRPSQIVAIREYTNEDVTKMRRLYEILDHDNVLTARECFLNEGCMYALVNDLPLTLEQLVGCRSLYPTEAELASIAWQVLALNTFFNYPELIAV
ncbi:hypothetical protein N7492_002182 [Penicillium capsulatum]|uniref:Protein kinase domain-containing protein n=1 Tax=Penicillium capsulatum TaxID=69766 RepID=A0A9W9LW43_9EURO|nr:hypothetical protein N7492_002182 [Penicillium capsulatum]